MPSTIEWQADNGVANPVCITSLNLVPIPSSCVVSISNPDLDEDPASHKLESDDSFNYPNEKIQTRSITNFGFELIPNPAYDRVRIMVDGLDRDAELILFDLSGRKVSSMDVKPDQRRIDIDLTDSKYLSGVYIVQLRTVNKTEIKRLVIQK